MSQLFASGGRNIGTSASVSVSVSSNEYSGLISFRTDWFDLLAVEGFSMDTQKDSIKTLAHLT